MQCSLCGPHNPPLAAHLKHSWYKPRYFHPLKVINGSNTEQHLKRNVCRGASQRHLTPPPPFCLLFLITYPEHGPVCGGVEGRRARNLLSLSVWARNLLSLLQGREEHTDASQMPVSSASGALPDLVTCCLSLSASGALPNLVTCCLSLCVRCTAQPRGS